MNRLTNQAIIKLCHDVQIGTGGMDYADALNKIGEEMEARVVQEDEQAGTFSCPICGIANPHEHTGEQIARHHGAIDAEDDISSALRHGASAIRGWAKYWSDHCIPADIEGALCDAEILDRHLSRYSSI